MKCHNELPSLPVSLKLTAAVVFNAGMGGFPLEIVQQQAELMAQCECRGAAPCNCKVHAGFWHAGF